ncbi:hypothetical protein GDO86_003064 [Hymenochirus boettgeri]|uniref:Caspase-1 n=1 Tax=Hymenochirus boettgeri TaxID=247094 RepID=A0A8T2K5I7_9PIPI|nr:hypothetical protein GDO86_003064 [Hymenochirus boettgeri]
MKSVIHCTDEEMKRICDFHGEMIYEVRKPKGRKRLALLICNESFTMLKERTGAQVDQNGMIKLLNELGYQVQLEKNLNSQNMLKVMKDFAAREEHLDSDSTFIVLMSHGEKDGICGTESHFSHTAKGQVVTDLLHFDHIFSTFNNINCAKLRNKPKVIIIQACRGHQDGRVLVSDDVALQGDDPMEDDAMKFVQRETDFVCFYSTTPDTVSWRHPNTGSLFIQCLIEKMNELAHCESLVDIFFKVQSSFAGKLQMPTQERKTLTKKFYLFPGH